ncbi:MAG: chorismate-binding protein [Acidobacteriota bacterium]
MSSPTCFGFVQTEPASFLCLEGRLRPATHGDRDTPALYAPAFDESPNGAWLRAEDARLEEVPHATWLVRFPPPADSPPPVAWGEPDEERFRHAFARLRDLIARGVLQKGVPASRIVAAIEPGAAETLFGHLLRRVPEQPAALMAYGLCRRDPTTGRLVEFMLGATPEVLFDLHDQHCLRTMAVAGTRWSSIGPDVLQSSAKDRDEHQFVVYDLINRLAAWGSASVSGTIVRSFGDLEHLVAEISLEARRPLVFEEVARELHPTPALGVYPRNQAGLAWLSDLDPRGERHRYGAPFGISVPARPSRCVVAIRNVQYRRGELSIWAGCGVVAQSRYEEEWQEVLDKMQTARVMWGL